MIRYDPTLVDLTSNFFVLCTHVKVYLKIIHSGWSLAWIFMKERVNIDHWNCLKHLHCGSQFMGFGTMDWIFVGKIYKLQYIKMTIYTFSILMHLLLYCDVWLDNIKHLGQYTVANTCSLTSLIITHFVGWHAALCISQHSNLRWECNRMGIIILKNFIWGGISSYIHSEIMFYGTACGSP